MKLRLNKGQGIQRDNLQILRDSMFISVITYNLEVSINMTKSDIKALDDLDLSLMRKAMCLSSKSSRPLIYLETGIISVEYILKKKRIMYLHHLLNCDDSSLSESVLLAQIKCP